MPLTVIEKASVQPVDINLLKQHLRLVVDNPASYTVEDEVLSLLIDAVTMAYQDRFKTQLMTATLRWDFQQFRKEMELPRPPLQSVESVVYIDAEGNEQPVADSNYEVIESHVNPGMVRFNWEFTFPELHKDTKYPVRVEYKAGYGDNISDVDPDIQLYLMSTIGTYYMQRESMLTSYTGGISVVEMSKQMSFLLSGKPKAMRFG